MENTYLKISTEGFLVVFERTLFHYLHIVEAGQPLQPLTAAGDLYL